MTNDETLSARDRQLAEMAAAVRGGYRTVEDRTESFLREAILRGVYRPGERLHQDAIAALLGVSRMPVRASLRQLEAEGLVSIKPHVGATVSVLQPHEIAELYELRIRLECYLLEHAIPNLTPEVLEELSELVRQTDASAEPHRPPYSPDGVISDDAARNDWLERRRAFYGRLYGLANRPRAQEMAERLRSAVGRYLLLKRVDEHPGAHLGLLKHLRDADVEGAQRWVETHLSRVSEQLQHLVANTGSDV